MSTSFGEISLSKVSIGGSAPATAGDRRRRAAATALSCLLWPAILAACLWATWRGIAAGQAALWFNGTYACLALTLFALERAMPYERRWLENDGQILPDLAHTLLNKGFAQMLVVVGVAVGVAEVVASKGGDLWPVHWPLPAQILLGLLIVEAGLYAAHRLAHEWPLLWRFHAVHHSAPRLWFFNTGRFHPVDTATSILLSQPLLFLASAPSEIFIWVTSITAYVGMLTHCNVAMRFGPLSRLFNTPAVHRWHHSRDPREGNANYGENLMIFDLIFGTFYLPDRRPPADIGIDAPMPAGFVGQVLHPFRRQPATLAGADGD